MTNAVNHPKHYKSNTYECIDVMLDIYGKEAVIEFCKLNAFKYLWRCDKKSNTTEDLQKAKWYIEKAIELSVGTVTASNDRFFSQDYPDE